MFTFTIKVTRYFDVCVHISVQPRTNRKRVYTAHKYSNIFGWRFNNQYVFSSPLRYSPCDVGIAFEVSWNVIESWLPSAFLTTWQLMISCCADDIRGSVSGSANWLDSLYFPNFSRRTHCTRHLLCDTPAGVTYLVLSSLPRLYAPSGVDGYLVNETREYSFNATENIGWRTNGWLRTLGHVFYTDGVHPGEVTR